MATVPGDLRSAVAAALAAPGFDGAEVSASVWIQGIGEVAGLGLDRPLLPASNQKLLTAMGALALLGPDHRVATQVLHAGDDLVLVAGGDPALTRTGPHSLAALAAQVRASGVTRVAGELVVDVSRYGRAVRAPGWQAWHVPTYAGPLSALTVDGNRHRTDPAFLADPATGNGEAFRAALAAAGVDVSGRTVVGTAPTGARSVASLTSASVVELVQEMLLVSDNEHAEFLVREVGRVELGRGTTRAGAAAITAWLEEQCLDLEGRSSDGSGLSRTNARTARDLREVLQFAAGQPWWPALVAGLPVSGRSGTLAGRLDGPATAGQVRAKTGTILVGSALSGYATTTGGRLITFSVIANHPDPTPLAAAIDGLVTTVVAWPG
ncbi:MAG TPA: D-alanyl-D-alanine carboxypeptidase/D-alanyl-D-alanine-endopeptidase [Acidimicrobiales bacterium]|nr:D-alanyl-D-alanine carboxypeptidase/D-alanyl-D-alanine-endopeptidase [Acidimicrobiales bacterium]